MQRKLALELTNFPTSINTHKDILTLKSTVVFYQVEITGSSCQTRHSQAETSGINVNKLKDR